MINISLTVASYISVRAIKVGIFADHVVIPCPLKATQALSANQATQGLQFQEGEEMEFRLFRARHGDGQFHSVGGQGSWAQLVE